MTVPCTKKTDWCEGEGVRSQVGQPSCHNPTACRQAHPKHPVLLHITSTPDPRWLSGLSKYQTSNRLLRTFWYSFRAKDGSTDVAVTLLGSQVLVRAGQGPGKGKRLVVRRLSTTHTQFLNVTRLRTIRVKKKKRSKLKVHLFYFQQ